MEQLEEEGFRVTYLPVDRQGLIRLEDLHAAVREDTILISIMHANNETGAIQDLRAVGRFAREKGILFHSDAVQSTGKIPVDVNDLGVDLLSLSGHKTHGPKGIGALYIRQGVEMKSLLLGGSHERGRRGGTENVPGIVGLGKAAVLARDVLGGFQPPGPIPSRPARDGTPGTYSPDHNQWIDAPKDASHHQLEFSRRRGRSPPHFIGPSGDRRLNGCGLLFGIVGAFSRLEGHGVREPQGRECASAQPQPDDHRGRDHDGSGSAPANHPEDAGALSSLPGKSRPCTARRPKNSFVSFPTGEALPAPPIRPEPRTRSAATSPIST